MIKCTVRLPRNSTVLCGEALAPTAFQARQRAAMDACIQLHKAGEIDDNLKFKPQYRGKQASKSSESMDGADRGKSAADAEADASDPWKYVEHSFVVESSVDQSIHNGLKRIITRIALESRLISY